MADYTLNYTGEKINALLNKVEAGPRWDEVSGKPTIPTKTSELTNDSNYATVADIEAYVEEAILGGEW